jgi:hypothetical protein
VTSVMSRHATNRAASCATCCPDCVAAPLRGEQNGPDFAELQWRLLPGHLALVPRYARHAAGNRRFHDDLLSREGRLSLRQPPEAIPNPLRSSAPPRPGRRICGYSRHSSLRVGRQVIGRSAHCGSKETDTAWPLSLGGAGSHSAFRNKPCVAEQPLINVAVESRAQFRGG